MKLHIALVSLALLAGCTKPASDTAPTADAPAEPAATEQTPPATAADAPAASPTSPPAGGMVMGMGEVTAADASAGTITISHGPIEALKWPAMTMAFQATPEQIASVKPGDAIHFEFEQANGQARLSKVSPSK